MIFAKRITLSGELELCSDLHIGGCNTAHDDNGHEYALTMRNNERMPIIPASSLKGVLRAALVLHGECNAAKRLFGEQSKHEDGTGGAARLWLDHAVLTTPATGLEGLSADPVENGVFRAKHVALDPATGAAEDHKLFTREMVAAGAIFAFQADWFGNDVTCIAPVLALLRDGIQLGRGGTKGHGLVKLDMTKLTLSEHVPGTAAPTNLNATTLCQAVKDINFTPLPTTTVTLTLSCEGPYMSVRKVGGDVLNNRSLPLEIADCPVLWPESLAGALRGRARWLAGIQAAEADTVDDPGRKRSPDALRDLTAVEALFGVTGSKGKLSVQEVICTNAGNRVCFTNTSIDRFTGATRNKVLFEKEAFWQPEFKAIIEVSGDHPILDTLLDDLKTEGLELGHGASTGFGWFRVAVDKTEVGNDDGT